MESGKVVVFDAADFESTLQQATSTSISALHHLGEHIVVAEPIPLAPFDPIICLSDAARAVPAPDRGKDDI